MAVVAVILLVGGVFPEVKDPWPSSIGLDFPFTLAGAFGVLADIVGGDFHRMRGDRFVRRAGAVGFVAGAAVYVGALLNQLSFGL